jgi:hypothetical protein
VIWRVDILLELLVGMLVLYGILTALDKATDEFRSINIIAIVVILVIIWSIFTVVKLEIL